jgi:16S rRNA (cytidine1402-2'-O)-methyltransferase
MKQSFYVVATPIGNLGDITFRAVEVLKSVDAVLCEDTRVTGKLFSHYNINTQKISYPSDWVRGSGAGVSPKIESILALIEEGKTLALVSDAGTPGVSDPGAVLVSIIRQRFPKLSIVAIPGPSALSATISVAGIPATDFTFLGFLPHKKGRETIFREIAQSQRTIVFYESPHRIMKSLSSLAEVLGMSTRRVVIARELTKLFEEVVSGSIQEVQAHFIAHPDTIRGEFVVLVAGV